MAAFNQRNEAPVEFAMLSKFLLRDFICFFEIFYYFSKCLFDCQVRLLMELNRNKRDILLTIDNKTFINSVPTDWNERFGQ